MKRTYDGNVLGPLPLALVGANVGGRPNYLVIGYIAPMKFGKQVFFSINRKRYTSLGILENGTFSVNVPSADLVDDVKRCGGTSGRNVDKSAWFEAFYGALETAPMIRACSLNMECEVVEILTTKHSHNVIGRVVKSYVDEGLLSEERVDMRHAGLMSWTIGGELNLYALGEQVGSFHDEEEAR